MNSSQTGNKAYNRKKWSILFIGEDGKVVTIKHFKGMVTGLAMLLGILIVVVVVLYYQYQNRTGRIEALRNDMAGVVTENRTLRDEKEQMLARLVILESKLKARKQQGPPEGIGEAPGKGETLKDAGKDAGDKSASPDVKQEKEPKEVQEQAVTPVAAESQDVVPPVNIANKNLVVCQDPTSEDMRVEYKVFNTGAKDVPVAGRSVIVLKGDNMNTEDWVVLPNVPLADLKPSGERGKRFRIYNFRTLKYKVPSSAVKGRLATATIFTFTEDGKLVTERDYPIETSAEMCP